MKKSDFGGVEEEAGAPGSIQFRPFFSGVFFVGDDGVAEILEVNPNLMGAAGFGKETEE